MGIKNLNAKQTTMKQLWKGQFGPLLLSAVLAFSFSLSSCEWFKPARDSDKEKVYTDDDIGDLQGTKVFDPETGEWRTVREVNGKMETVKWTDLDEDKNPPITSDGSWTTNGNTGGAANTGGGGNYNVSLVLPFLANRSASSNIDENAYWAIHFYSGAKLAYETLAREGANLNVNIVDSEGAAGKVNRLINSNGMRSADLVIGPYKRENVKILGDYSKREKKPLAVPYTAQLGLSEGNPNYIQLNPSLESHCVAIMRHARQRYDIEDIVLVARDNSSEKGRLAYFQNENKVIEGRDVGVNLAEFIVKDATLDFSEMDISPYVREGKTTVFIVPSWKEEFVYSVLRQLMMKQSIGEDIVVYGMPQWVDFEQVDPDFYQNLNVHISSAFYVDSNDERIKQFNRKFFDTYGTIPLDEAYLGYDAMLYFGRMLDKHGRDFARKLDVEPYDVLHGRYEFDRVVLRPEEHQEDLDFYDQLENQFVHILEFRDYRFQPAN